MADLMMELTVNGKKVRKAAQTHMRLLDFVREELFLTGTKEGCGEGECGTCSVLVNGVNQELSAPCRQGTGCRDQDHRRPRHSWQASPGAASLHP
jgi:aerobic-type carbon monoxide dehydrogenase small subunit (CoxS/CutS family)